MCHSGKSLFEDFLELNFNSNPLTHTQTHTYTYRSANQCKHKFNGKVKLAQKKFCFSPCNTRVMLSCKSYWTISAQGSWVWLVKIKQTLMKWTVGGEERAAVDWWKKPSNSERWECNSVVLTRVTRLTAWTPADCPKRKEQTIGFYRHTVEVVANK